MDDYRSNKIDCDACVKELFEARERGGAIAFGKGSPFPTLESALKHVVLLENAGHGELAHNFRMLAVAFFKHDEPSSKK